MIFALQAAANRRSSSHNFLLGVLGLAPWSPDRECDMNIPLVCRQAAESCHHLCHLEVGHLKVAHPGDASDQKALINSIEV